MNRPTQFKELSETTQAMWFDLMENIINHSCLDDFYKCEGVDELLLPNESTGFYPFYRGGLQAKVYTTHGSFSSAGRYPEHINEDWEEIIKEWNSEHPDNLYEDIAEHPDSEVMHEFYEYESDFLQQSVYDVEINLTYHTHDNFSDELEKHHIKITVSETGKKDKTFKILEGDFDNKEIKEHIEKEIIEGLL